MANKRHYDVLNVFPVRVKVKDAEGKETTEVKRVSIATADKIEEWLTAAQIKEHITAGDLADNGPVTPAAK